MTSRESIRRVGSRDARWPLHDIAASRSAERAAATAGPPHALMARAGLAVARLALAVAPHAARLQVWAGPGNNGGDGLVAARHLHLAGRPVRVTLLGDADSLPPDARWAFDEARASGVTIAAALPADAPRCDLAIDALLGLGASRAPAGAMAAAIAAINRTGGPVLAVDLPSGLNADTGALLGDGAVVATSTLSLLTLKPGCFTASGRDHAGSVWLDTLGVDAGSPSAWLSRESARYARPFGSHKGSFGDVAVIGGTRGMVGAAWLASRAALAAGAGRVICSTLADAPDDAAGLDPQRPELVSRRGFWRSEAPVLASTTVVCGCGGGNDMAVALPALLAAVSQLVIDADGLNAIAGDAALRAALTGRAARGQATILTPHPLEAARLLRSSAAQVQQDRLRAAKTLAEELGVTVVLKGSGTVIAAPGRTPRINASGNAALSTAGTGDVLAGWTGGLWAQRSGCEPIDVATRAAGQHGAAADDWQAQGHGGPLLASDLIAALSRG